MTRSELFSKYSLEMADIEVHPALKELNLSEYSRQLVAEAYIIYKYGSDDMLLNRHIDMMGHVKELYHGPLTWAEQVEDMNRQYDREVAAKYFGDPGKIGQ